MIPLGRWLHQLQRAAFKTMSSGNYLIGTSAGGPKFPRDQIASMMERARPVRQPFTMTFVAPAFTGGGSGDRR